MLGNGYCGIMDINVNRGQRAGGRGYGACVLMDVRGRDATEQAQF